MFHIRRKIFSIQLVFMPEAPVYIVSTLKMPEFPRDSLALRIKPIIFSQHGRKDGGNILQTTFTRIFNISGRRFSSHTL